MAIDSSIALQSQPPNIAGSINNAFALRNQVQQGQLQQVQLQQAQQAQADQKAMTTAMQQWDGQDYTKLPSLVLKNGGSANAVFAANQHIMGLKQQVSDIAAKDAETGSKNTETLIKNNDQKRGRLTSIISAPDDQKQQLWDSEITQEEQSGQIKPGQVSHTYPGDDQATVLANHYALGSTLAKEATEQQTANAKEMEAQNASKRFTAEMPGGPMQPVEQKELSDYLAKNPGKGPSDFAAWKAKQAPLAQFNLQNSGLNAGGGNGQPSNMAQMVANGQMKWGDIISPRTPMAVKVQFANEVKQINPNFNSADYGVEQKLRNSFVSGPVSQELNAFNTASAHADLLSQAATAMNNGDNRTLNTVKNKFKTEFGSPDVTNFEAIANAYNHEVTSALSKGHITDAEIKTGGMTLPSNASPEQIMGAVNNYKALMQSKIQQRQNQYDKGSQGQPNFPTQGSGNQNQPAQNTPAPMTITLPSGKKVTIE